MGEAFFQFGIPGNCPVAILRLPGIYGPGDLGISIVGKFASQLREKGRVRITGTGSSKRDFVEVGDLCRVIQILLEGPYHGVLNIATGKSVSIKQTAEIIAEQLNIPLEIDSLPGDAARDHDLVFDVKLLRSLCPELSMKDLRRGIKGYPNTPLP